MGLTSSIDLAEILFTLFWLFFIGLVIYLRREDKREGYPLDSDRSGRVSVQGFPAIPGAKEFALTHGGSQFAPREEPPETDLAAEPAAPHPGAPLVPTGNPMLDGIGPAAYAQRSEQPDRTIDGKPRIVPMRTADGFKVDRRDPDPRGMSVVGADGATAGTVADLWVDLVEPMICYFEVQLSGENARNVLLPIGFAKVNRRRSQIDVKAIYAAQFADVPATASNEQISCLEEDRICAYYAGGTLYADASRQEPLF
jgi:photosynthetic reaction center H subunit